MTVVSWGRVVLFSVWPFFLLWVECLTFYYFFFFSSCCCALLPLWMECVWRKQTFLCAFIFYEILFWRELMVWPKRYKHEPPASTVLWGVFFFVFFSFCVLWGRKAEGDAVWPLRPPHPRFSGGPGGGSSDKSTMRQIWIWVWNKRKERDTASTNC